MAAAVFHLAPGAYRTEVMDGRRMPQVQWYFGEAAHVNDARRLAARSEGEGGEALGGVGLIMIGNALAHGRVRHGMDAYCADPAPA